MVYQPSIGLLPIGLCLSSTTIGPYRAPAIELPAAAAKASGCGLRISRLYTTLRLRNRGCYAFHKDRTSMKLAEALSLRADLQQRIAQLKGRIKTASKVQEGDEPTEDVNSLLEELGRLLEQLETLIFRINLTNVQTVDKGQSLTALMARRDVLTMRVKALREVLDYLTEPTARYSRQEIKFVNTVDVPTLHRQTDEYARALRELDLRIQGLNWSVDLV